MAKVIVVPEKDEFREDVFHGEEIYINEKHGEPQLDYHDARYIAPFLLKEQKVLRVYEILEMKYNAPNYEFYLGNSYLVKDGWDNMGQHRRFAYYDLKEFGFKEIQTGFLQPI